MMLKNAWRTQRKCTTMYTLNTAALFSSEFRGNPLVFRQQAFSDPS